MEPQAVTETLTTQAHGHVTILTFANPPHNHANVPLLERLGEALALADADGNCRVVLLRSEGKIFCAGADLAAPGDGMGSSQDDPILEFYEKAIRLFDTKKPMVVAIQGAAVGAGLGLALVADFRIASQDARFSANFVKLGFHPGFALTHSLPRIIGGPRAAEMFLTGDRFKAEEVAPWGLVDQVVPAAELDEAALAFAQRIAVNAPLALIDTRATLREGLVAAANATLKVEYAKQARLKETADYAEGVAAVFARRPANFIGR